MLGAMVYISGGVSSQFGACVHACVCVKFWLLSSHRRGWRPGQRELDKSVGLTQLRFAGQGLKCLLKECASISYNTLWLLFCRVRTQTELMPTAVLPPYVPFLFFLIDRDASCRALHRTAADSSLLQWGKSGSECSEFFALGASVSVPLCTSVR